MSVPVQHGAGGGDELFCYNFVIVIVIVVVIVDLIGEVWLRVRGAGERPVRAPELLHSGGRGVPGELHLQRCPVPPVYLGGRLQALVCHR